MAVGVLSRALKTSLGKPRNVKCPKNFQTQEYSIFAHFLS